MDVIHCGEFAGQRLRFVISFHLILIPLYQTAANYIVSQLAVWEINFPGGVSNDNIKWRALIWAISEGLLFVSVAINYLPPRFYSAVFRFSIFIIMLDFFLCLIWLPIGVSKTYGFRSAKDVFTMSCMSSSKKWS
jgi:translation initiation factor 5B